VALLVVGWFMGVFCLGPETPASVAPTEGRPSDAYSQLFQLFRLERPSVLDRTALWLQTHPEMAAMMAAMSGMAAHGSVLRSKSAGFMAPTAWLGLIASIEGLGATHALRIAAVPFLTVLVIAVSTVALSKKNKPIQEWEISWQSVGNKLMVNVVKLVVLPYLPVIVLGWLIHAYGYEGVRRPVAPPAPRFPPASVRPTPRTPIANRRSSQT
jgi:hypothetical protein